MSGVFYLRNVLQLIVHRFNDSSLSEKKFVGNAHQRALHIAFQLGDKLYSVNEESLKEIPADIPLIANQLPVYKFHKCFVFQRFTVINIPWRYHEIEELPFLITNQMQFESEEPPHRALSSLRNAFEYLVNVYSLVSADTKWCTVNKADSRTFAQQDFLDKQSQGDGSFSFQFHETVVRDDLRKQMTQMLTHLFKVEMFQAAITGVVEKNHDKHDSAFDIVQAR
jgi:hypothetical protein